MINKCRATQSIMIELIICEENGIVEGKIRVVTVANIDGGLDPCTSFKNSIRRKA